MVSFPARRVRAQNRRLASRVQVKIRLAAAARSTTSRAASCVDWRIVGCAVESCQLLTLPSRKLRHVLTVCRAFCRPGQACYHHHRSKKPVAFADLVEPASLLVLAIAEPMKSPAPITAAVASRFANAALLASFSRIRRLQRRVLRCIRLVAKRDGRVACQRYA